MVMYVEGRSLGLGRGLGFEVLAWVWALWVRSFQLGSDLLWAVAYLRNLV
jgi:hypothetical protein